jgi:predicted RNA-binding protein YlxR (DUF448 family)
MKARKKNAFARVLKRPVDGEIYARVAELIRSGRGDGVA